MMFNEIPLTANNQTFAIQLGKNYVRLRLIYRDSAGWILDLETTAGEIIVSGIPLVTGADLLAQYSYLGLGGLMVVTEEDVQDYPTKTDLGYGSHLYFVQI